MLESCIYTCRRDAYVVKGCKQEMLPFPLMKGCNSWEEEGVFSWKFAGLNSVDWAGNSVNWKYEVKFLGPNSVDCAGNSVDWNCACV